MIEIHTDGSCLGNPGRGGWAAIVVRDGAKSALSGHEHRTTNNRMEITAVVEGLASLPPGSDVKVFSDSEYVISTMTRNWKRNANKDLWARLDAEVGKRNVRWQWVKGHAGNPLNEEADALAHREAEGNRANGPEGNGGSGPSGSLSHLDEAGNARMVDVGAKPATERVAVARGSVVMKAETLALIRSSGLEKGDVLGVARVAGIMAAKSTSQLIPMCHPLPLDQVTVEFELDDQASAVDITATARTTAKTGVEMEAMTAVTVAALTVYDMCKAVDRRIRIQNIRLARKSGGKNGDIVLED
jgi:cyclic pyranopterin phosphate synthase